ncbi:MAG: type II/IV secretion system protein [Phycisphaerales bacterium]|nr:type II/IV secretion system protein [Phycisphaerales bacterium]
MSHVAEVKPLGAGVALGAGVTATAEMRASDAADASKLSSPETSAVDTPSREFLRLIPYDFARRHLVLGLEGSADGPARLAVGSTTSLVAIFNVGVAMKRASASEPVDDVALAEAIDRAYAGAAEEREEERTRGHSELGPNGPIPSTPILAGDGSVITGGLGAGLGPDLGSGLGSGVGSGVGSGLSSGMDSSLWSTQLDVELTRSLDESRRDADLLDTSGKAAVVRLVDLVLFEAIRRGASDVHIQPIQGRVLVRYRMDGVLHTVRELAAGSSLALAIITRIKVIARLDVAERRAPQDGRAAVTLGTTGRRVDLRVSTLPSTYGERVVIRLLDPERSARSLSFGALGMPPELERRYLQIASRASGTLLSTGPTGSGKTTTLYTTLSWISASNAASSRHGCELNILTIEDPVEYDLSTAGLSVSQTQVDPKKGVTFAAGLRHILRQDPDVIMVGEVRDQETARIAVQASLTGHLVLSTLHTNDAASAVARLIDLGVEPFLVASSLSGVLAQRLVRTLHQPCKGTGCAECLHSGFRGRTGVFELLAIDPGIRALIESRRSSPEIKALAVSRGMTTLAQAGQELIAKGVTTRTEVTRVIETVDEEDVASFARDTPGGVDHASAPGGVVNPVDHAHAHGTTVTPTSASEARA